PFTNIFNVMAETIYVIPKALVEEDETAFEEHPIGSGPYKFSDRGRDGSVVLESNDDYFLGEPQIKEVTINQPMDYSTSVVALENGDVDMVQNVPSDLLDQIRGQSDLALTEEVGWSVKVMLFPSEPFS